MSSLVCKALSIVISSLFSGKYSEVPASSTSRIVWSIIHREKSWCLSLWWDFCFVVCFRAVCYYYYLLIRDFLISFSWWSFTGVWVTASLLKSLELFSIFWLFSIISPTSKSSCPLNNPLVTVPRAPITKALWMVINYLVHLLCSYLVHFENGSDYLTREIAWVLISLMRFLLLSFGKFSCSSAIRFFDFLFLLIFLGIRFRYSQVLINFFSKYSIPFLIAYSFRFSSLPSFSLPRWYIF